MSMIHVASDRNLSSLTNIQEGDIQPNAVDLRLDRVFKPNVLPFTLKADGSKEHRGSVEIKPAADGYFHLHPGTYEVIMENIVTIGPDEAGWVITRSTLNRNGVFLTSGLYDSGYSGVMAAAMHIFGDGVKIELGSRIGQFLLFKSESIGSYNGSYGSESDHDKKYVGKENNS